MIQNYKETFVQEYLQHIHREGSKELLEVLCNQSNFFQDPASSKYHLAEPGGLVEHSVHVYDRLLWLCHVEASRNEYFKQPSTETIAIVGLLHDLCKANTYLAKTERVKKYITRDASLRLDPMDVSKDSEGYYVWDNRTTYTKQDAYPYGHGEKSVYLIQKYMKLTDEEALAIRYHMGSWNANEANDASYVFQHSELSMLLHMADEFATFVDER